MTPYFLGMGCRKWLAYKAAETESEKGIRSDQISRSVVSDSLRPHELQHARPPCPSPTPGVHSDSCHRVSDARSEEHTV